MQKNITKLEKEIDGRIYEVLCDMDSPISSLKIALQEFHSYCEQIEKIVAEQMASLEAEKEVIEPTESC